MHLSRRITITAVAAVAVATLGGAGIGYAAASAGPAIQTRTPHSEREMTNIDVLRQQIRNYYGDELGTGVFSDDSYYAREARSVAADGKHYLAGKHTKKTKAILLDVDDTSLATYNYEIASNWAYNPTSNAAYVTGELFPAVPGMVDLVKSAQKQGYAIFFLTGRPATQEAVTLGNLTDSDTIGLDAGYPTPTALKDGEDGLFTKPAIADYPDYLKSACAADTKGSCTTIHYKSATRAHIESLGYDIVANFGDQYSDLNGGFADKTFKLPNPMYYLP
jgi:predicted secreted acid phosphatase